MIRVKPLCHMSWHRDECCKCVPEVVPKCTRIQCDPELGGNGGIHWMHVCSATAVLQQTSAPNGYVSGARSASCSVIIVIILAPLWSLSHSFSHKINKIL